MSTPDTATAPDAVTALTALTEALRDDRDRNAGDPSEDRSRPRAQRRRAGAYFTPASLVQFTVAETLAARFAESPVTWRADGSPALQILDPCAGDGRFLNASADFLVKRSPGYASASEPERVHLRAAVVRQCLIAIERDAEFAALCRQNLGCGARVFTGDALLGPPELLGSAGAPGMDVVVGNPPYVRSINMDPLVRKALADRYVATSFGEWDLYLAFIEQTHQWLAAHGHAGLVVPSRWFTSATASRLRGALVDAGAVRKVVDFGATQVFADATTYTSVTFLTHTRQTRVDIARLVVTENRATWQRGHRAMATLSASPWSLAVGEDRSLMTRLLGGPTLGEVAQIVKGAGTSADRVYVLEQAEATAVHVRGRSRAAEGVVELERAVCRPCVRGRDIRPYGPLDGTVQCLTPYARNGSLMAPEQLHRYPLATAHLRRFRPLLIARESGKYADAAYYRFGRAQNMALLGSPEGKVVVPDVAKAGRALLDRSGALVLDSAYAVCLRPAARGYTLELILAVLHAPIVRFWLTRTGIPLRGGYMRLKTAYLSSLPLPPLSEHTERAHALVHAGLAAGRVKRAAADRQVRLAYGLDVDSWRRLT